LGLLNKLICAGAARTFPPGVIFWPRWGNLWVTASVSEPSR
jgi:hypothetical protein